MGNKTRIHQGSNGQFKTTVPKGIGEAMDLDGKRVEWQVESAATLKLSVINE